MRSETAFKSFFTDRCKVYTEPGKFLRKKQNTTFTQRFFMTSRLVKPMYSYPLIFSNLFLHNIPGLRGHIQGKIDADDNRELNTAWQDKEVKSFSFKIPN